MQTFFERLSSILSALIETLLVLLRLGFGILLISLALYIAVTVAYNMLLARERREAEKKKDPPTARRGPTIYP